jgi:two-component system sensor histidine kinase KdpD
MDTKLIIDRAPQLVLIDELAHTNIPGSEREKRYQDVEVILAAGIDVYSTVNIQHIENLNDLVARITGVVVRERIPDRLLDEADEIVVVEDPDRFLTKEEALHVETCEKLCREFGGEFVRVKSHNVPAAIVEIAQRERITQIVN